MTDKAKETWASGGAYEQYVGRWSRKVAREFLAWLRLSPGQTWGDVGCGSGALVDSILNESNPKVIMAIDRSEVFIAEAQHKIGDSRVRFEVGDATAIPWSSGSCDVAVSGLVLNFVSDAGSMAKEMARVTRPGGKVAAYVWDYARGMQMMRHFWDVAVELNPDDSRLDEAKRFPLCQPGPLEALFRGAGLTSISVRPIDIPTVFRDFDDYWLPFLGKQGPAPTYLASLNEETQNRIRDALKARLVASTDGSIAMTARAWAVQGMVRPKGKLGA
ncbi:MAG TPA: methyltransferase domain-containing protein [Candidatus Binatia bacterium]|nr:methyltransferase domain-containing protein [Candidatus Binatia bacterium]